MLSMMIGPGIVVLVLCHLLCIIMGSLGIIGSCSAVDGRKGNISSNSIRAEMSVFHHLRSQMWWAYLDAETKSATPEKCAYICFSLSSWCILLADNEKFFQSRWSVTQGGWIKPTNDGSRDRAVVKIHNRVVILQNVTFLKQAYILNNYCEPQIKWIS